MHQYEKPARQRYNSLITFEDRPSDSRFIERVWRSRTDRAGEFRSLASCHWGMVITQVDGKISFTVRGPESKATLADCPAQGEWVGVLFKLGTYMPLMRSAELRDRNDLTLPNATKRSFWLHGSAWEFPSFENIETFVSQLVGLGLVQADPTTTNILRGEFANQSARTTQRRVLQITGLTQGAIHQIERARQAVLLLRSGVSILDVVHRTGYYDQAHLTRSLQRFTGQSPGRIAQQREQLSLLYNKHPASPARVRP